MGFPVIAALASLAAAGAGTGMQMAAASSTRSAQNKAVNEELQRQQGYQQKGKSLFDASLSQSEVGTAQKQVNTGAAEREAAMTKAGQLPLTSSQASAPVQTQSADVVTPRLQQSAAAAAKMGGYSDWDLQQWIKNLRAQQNLMINSQLARQSEQVLPYEAQDALHSQDALNTGGRLTSSVGNMLGAYAGLGGGYSNLFGAGARPAVGWGTTGQNPASGWGGSWEGTKIPG